MLNTLNAHGTLGPTTERFPATKATAAEALAGVDNRKYMTPLRTKQSLGAEIEQAIEAVADQYDDVLAVAELPASGVAGRLYIVGATSYHWNGSGYDQVSGVNDWAEIENKPAEFPPAPHTSDKITDFVPAVNEVIAELDAGTY